MKAIFTSKRLFLLVVVLFLVNSMLLGRGMKHLAENFGWVEHTLRVRSAIGQVSTDVIAFNIAVRNNSVLGSHPPVPLALLDSVRRDVNQIQKLTVDNASQQINVGQLRTLVDSHLAIRDEGTSGADSIAFLSRLDESTQRIYALLLGMRVEETRLLGQRQVRAEATRQGIVLGLVIDSGGGVLLATLLYLYYARLQRRGEEQEKIIRNGLATLTSVLESTSDCVYTISYDWTLIYGNGKSIESLPDFKIGGNYWECFPGVLGTPVEGYLRNVMKDREPASFENLYAPYGRSYRVRVFPCEAGINVFFGDITEEKRVQAQLLLEQELREKRIEALSHMAGGLAHEISNPLAIIQGLASDLAEASKREAPVSTERVVQSAESILRTAERATRILRGLRGFGREAGQDPLERASIYEIIEECVDLQQARLDRHHIQLRMDLHPDMPKILCREVQISQIMTNLINNAFDALVQTRSPVNSERWISIRTETLDRGISVDVTDSGPGIEEKYRTHILEPFFSTKKNGFGTGIGLSLSRAIAEDHGGSLVLVEDTEHTCFRLILPVGREALKPHTDAHGLAQQVEARAEIRKG